MSICSERIFHLPPPKTELTGRNAHFVINIGVRPDAGVNAGRRRSLFTEKRLIVFFEHLNHRFDALRLIAHLGRVHFDLVLDTELGESRS